MTLQGFYDMQSFVVDTHAGTPVTVTAVGDPDGFVEAVASDGSVMEFSDSNETGAERLTFAGDGRVPTIVTLGQFSVGQGEFNVSFTHPAARYDDPDDGRELVAGRPLAGHIDHASDVDYYVFDLAAGQSVRITVDSIAFDPVLFVDSPTNEGPILAMDDDSAGGLLGLSSAVTFIAPSSGCYLLGTADFFRELTGGYVVEMAAAAPTHLCGHRDDSFWHGPERRIRTVRVRGRHQCAVGCGRGLLVRSGNVLRADRRPVGLVHSRRSAVREHSMERRLPGEHRTEHAHAGLVQRVTGH